MLLSDNFYAIIGQDEKNEDNGVVDCPVWKVNFIIKLNPEHPVYLGHFPGNPVVPGVCQIQIIKELTSALLKTDLVIHKSDNIKFLSMIIPSALPLLHVNIDIKEKEPNSWNVNSVIVSQDKVFLKFKGVMRPV